MLKFLEFRSSLVLVVGATAMFAAAAPSFAQQEPPRAPEERGLPPNFDKMSPEEQARYREMIRRRGEGRREGEPTEEDRRAREAERMRREQGDRARGDQDDRRDPRTEKERMRAEMNRSTQVEAPADRSAVEATFTIGGERREIHAGTFYDAFVLLKKFEEKPGMPVTRERVFEHLLAIAEAEALGFSCTEAEFLEDDALAKNDALKKVAEEGWARQNTTWDDYKRYEIERRTAQKIRDFYMNTLRLDTQNVFDLYKRDHFRYRLEYVAFSAKETAAEMMKAPPAEADLRRFWNDDKGVQNLFRNPTTVDAEFVYFDQSGSNDGGAAGPDVDASVGYDEALAYYRRNSFRLDNLLTPEQRAETIPGPNRTIAEIKTPFQLLKPVIEAEIRASGRVRVAFNEAKTAPKSDLKALADKYKLSYVKFEKADRQAFMTEPRFGFQIFPVLYASDPGKLAPDLGVERTTQYFWRLNAKDTSTLPTFEGVKDKLPPLYYEAEANLRAAEAAKACRAAIDAATEADLKSEIETKNAEADRNAEREATARNVTDGKLLDEIKARHRQIAAQQLMRTRNLAAGRVFSDAVKKLGLEVKVTGFFELAAPRFDRTAMTPEESLVFFLRSQAAIRTLEPGSVSQPLNDPSTKTHVIYKIAERAEPDFASISESDYIQMRATAERDLSYRTSTKFMFHEISQRLQLNQMK
jgi:hypothetical protein